MKCPKCSLNNPKSVARCLRCGTALPVHRKTKNRKQSAVLNSLIAALTIACLLGIIASVRNFLPSRASSYTTADAAPAQESGMTEGAVPYEDEKALQENRSIFNELSDTAPVDQTDPVQESALPEPEADDTPASDEKEESPIQRSAKRSASTDLLEQYYSSETHELKLPDSSVRLVLPEGTDVRASSYESNPAFLIQGVTEDGLLIEVSCSRLEVAPETRSEAIETSSTLYSQIGGNETLYYYVFRPGGLTALGNVVDCSNRWIAQISVTDPEESSEDDSGHSKLAYETLVNMFTAFENLQGQEPAPSD